MATITVLLPWQKKTENKTKREMQQIVKGITLESKRQGLTNGVHINILFIVVTLLLHLSKGDA